MSQSVCQFCSAVNFENVVSTYSFDSKEVKFSLIRCKECDLVRTEPFPTPSQLETYYIQDYYGKAGAKFAKPVEWFVKRANQVRARKLLNHLPKHEPKCTKIFDIGCGRANFLRYLAKQGYDAYGCELEGFSFPEYPEKITFWKGSLETLPVEESSFDAVSIWHVLEHVREPKAVIEKIGKILKPGGVLAVAVPNYDSIQAKLFPGHWFHLDLPRHLFHFKEKALCEMLSQAGLKIVGRSTQSWDQNLYGAIQSAMNAFLKVSEPNKFYSLLKNSPAPDQTIKRGVGLMGHGLIALCLFPFAVLENLVSVALGKGATLILYAEKE